VDIPIANELIYSREYWLHIAKRTGKRMTEALENMSDAERWKFLAWTDQRTPALAIVARGDQIRQVSPGSWSVASQSHPGTFHHVHQKGPKWECDCPFFAATSMNCIHVLSVRFREGFQESAPIPVVPKVACDKCQSADVTSKGVRHNKSGDLQRYVCRACGRRFVGRDGFLKRRADPNNIARSLELYYRGMSVRDVQEYLEQVERLKVSHMTVYRWIVAYSKLAAEWMDQQGARTSGSWHIDETVVNIDGRNEYLWNVLDGETRFALSTHISHDRSMKNTRIPIAKAKAATPDRPSDFFSDGMNSYPEAISKELGRRATPFDDPKQVKGHGWFTPHRRVPSIRAKLSNNKIARYHGTEKQRFKVMRAFDGPAGASVLSEGHRVHYNLVREHEALGMTPGEAAGIPMPDGMRWKAIIEKASRSRSVTPEAAPAEEDPKSR
jgi:transposase-like protein